MGDWVKGAAAVIGVLAGGAVGAAAIGTQVWKRATGSAVDALRSNDRQGTAVFSPDRLEGLPAPVVRFFESALTPGQRLVRRVRIEHSGTFRAGGLDGAWTPFHSTQVFTVDPPGFVWDASIRMAPLASVRVRDSYIGGTGAMLARLAGVIRVVDQKGSPELASGALHRWLGEANWFPTALLPGPALRWEAIDDSRARVTLEDAGHTVSVAFEFGPSGEVQRVSADRFRDVDGVGVPTPWVVELSGHSEVQGMRIPMEGEAAWLLPEGRLSYWRGRIDRITYDSGG